MKYCRVCGVSGMDDDAVFCKRCGKQELSPTGEPMPGQSSGATAPVARVGQPAPAPPPRLNEKAGCSWVGWACAVLFVLVIIMVATGADLSSPDSDDDGGSREGAFDVCTQFVEDRLRAPGTARFPNQFQDDGEVTIVATGADSFRVTSFVDAENGFGGEVRTPFECEVRHTGGGNWQLVSLNLVG